jgi:hypothetical protein
MFRETFSISLTFATPASIARVVEETRDVTSVVS